MIFIPRDAESRLCLTTNDCDWIYAVLPGIWPAGLAAPVALPLGWPYAWASRPVNSNGVHIQSSRSRYPTNYFVYSLSLFSVIILPSSCSGWGCRPPLRCGNLMNSKARKWQTPPDIWRMCNTEAISIFWWTHKEDGNVMFNTVYCMFQTNSFI